MNFKHLKSAIPAPIKEHWDKQHAQSLELLKKSGKTSKTTAFLALSFFLSFLSILGMCAFHWPQYLSTPEVRSHYNVYWLQWIMFGALCISSTVSVGGLFYKKHIAGHIVCLSLVAACWIWGGPFMKIADFPDHTPYIGLDWFILDLLVSVVVFASLEKLSPLRKGQALFRDGWQNDIKHFAFNHLAIGLMLVVVNFLIKQIFGRWEVDSYQYYVEQLPFVVGVVLCVLAADMAEYWTHRAYHEVPWLWKFHAVHHSSSHMDWLAGSRLHIVEILITRTLILGVVEFLGFSQAVINTYIAIVGIQAVVNHSNLKLPWGPLKYVFVTPEHHHWHHASDDVAIDKNYAAHYSFLDYLFGTAVRTKEKAGKHMPDKYGVIGDYVPEGFINQQMFPFKVGKQ